MGINARDFADSQNKAVDNRLPVGGWRVYPGYELWEREEDGARFFHLEARPIPWVEREVEAAHPAHDAGYRAGLEPDFSKVEVYAPLKMPGLFLEFANLLEGFEDGWVEREDVAGVVLDWVQRYGVLGRHGTYPTRDGGMIQGRTDTLESVSMFAASVVEANRALRLYSAATEPEGPNVEKLAESNVPGDTPGAVRDAAMTEVLLVVDKHLENETFTRLYRHRDGGHLFRGPGFHSLLGALWLQFSNLLTAPEEHIKRCLQCGDIIAFEAGEPPPSDVPKGTRRKRYKTRTDRDFCEEKDGVKNRCKNKYNYAQRKRSQVP